MTADESIQEITIHYIATTRTALKNNIKYYTENGVLLSTELEILFALQDGNKLILDHKEKKEVTTLDAEMELVRKEFAELKRGTFPQKERVIIEKVNIVKRHMRPSSEFPQGGIMEKEASVHVSNIMLLCPKCGQACRFGKKILEEGVKVRFCKKCGEVVDGGK